MLMQYQLLLLLLMHTFTHTFTRAGAADEVERAVASAREKHEQQLADATKRLEDKHARDVARQLETQNIRCCVFDGMECDGMCVCLGDGVHKGIAKGTRLF